MDAQRLRRLIDAGRSLVAETDLDTVLSQLLDAAREVTGARYAAVGVLDQRREHLERFLTAGLDDDARRRIGDLPRGRGVLGLLISDPRPLRLADVGSHPQSYGFPLGHPPMRTFLGVPILVGGAAWGNLYLTEKADGQFTADDEQAMVVLADWAALAIANARLYRDLQTRSDRLEHANRGLTTTAEIARALAGETELERVLELVVKRSRALTGARAAVLSLLDGEQLTIAAMAGEGLDGGRTGGRVALADALAAVALRTRSVQRHDDIPASTVERRDFRARTALIAPVGFRGRAVGVLAMFDRLEAQDGRFRDEDAELLEAFAVTAAAAIATAQDVAADRLRRSLHASEQERQRWARELHDETLQDMAALKVLLSTAQRQDNPAATQAALEQALEQLKTGIAELRNLITDLRPAALDELGTEPALRALSARIAGQTGLDIELEIDLDYEQGRAATRHMPELEAAIYRLVQEALTNTTKHARAGRAAVHIHEHDGKAEIRIRDDGHGFDPETSTDGFGLTGMRERVALHDGTITITSHPGHGTTIHAELPVRRRPADRGADTPRAVSA